MDLEKCKCGNEYFERKYFFEKHDAKYLKHQYYKQYEYFVCDKCGEPLQHIAPNRILGGLGGF